MPFIGPKAGSTVKKQEIGCPSEGQLCDILEGQSDSIAHQLLETRKRAHVIIYRFLLLNYRLQPSFFLTINMFITCSSIKSSYTNSKFMQPNVT